MNAMHSMLANARSILDKYGQQHLLKFYEELDGRQQEALLSQILETDFELITRLYNGLAAGSHDRKLPSDLKPLKSFDWSGCSEEEKKRHFDTGMKAIKDGRVAAVLVAGGQGTRLGYDGPKGTFKLDIPSGKSLFQIQCERLAKLSRDAGSVIPWYIMTSQENNRDTVEFFEANNFFGYPREDMFFFIQDSLPVVDEQGKILLSDKGRISSGPNGNGGCFAALEKSGALRDMERRGVEWIFLYGVDNALIRVADPAFVGFTINSKMPASSKVVKKARPEEKVAVFCYCDGKPYLIEYSELPEELMYKRDEKGDLVFADGSIAIHLFRRDFIEKYALSGLPYHIAHKKIPHVDSCGNHVKPEKPNAYKFEMFMFDIFAYLPDLVAFRVAREEEFAPVKNAEGEDSPATAKALLLGLHKKWLLEAGVPEKLLEGREVEISPLTSYAGEGLDVGEIIKKLETAGKRVVL